VKSHSAEQLSASEEGLCSVVSLTDVSKEVPSFKTFSLVYLKNVKSPGSFMMDAPVLCWVW
jgi:hypothetical protein